MLGMSDSELEAACELDSQGLSPWFHWTSELYGFGKCFRAYARFPKLLPLCVYSDHGVGLNANLFPHEVNNLAKVHLTFHRAKAERSQSRSDREVIYVMHPWIWYRRFKGFRQSASARGTIAFVPHHVPGWQWERNSPAEYFEALRALPQKFQPVVLCLHMHDIKSGTHRELRRYGLPIVTTGNSSSTQFADRFYQLATQFSYATSPHWGSQVAYCIELGIPYFYYGPWPKLINVGHEDLPLGERQYDDDVHRDYDVLARRLFAESIDMVTAEQRSFIEGLLGLDSQTTPGHLSWILWREFFRSWRQWWPLWIGPILRTVRKRGLRGFVLKARQQLRINRS
jgi:hypothetical protein